MHTNILEGKAFVLGLEADWDTYYETIVEFVGTQTIGEFTYHVFQEIGTDRRLYLSPRYVDDFVERAIMEPVIVNISEVQSDTTLPSPQHPMFIATGSLTLRE